MYYQQTDQNPYYPPQYVQQPISQPIYTPPDDNKFPQRTSYRDPVWALLFIVHLIVVIILFGVGSAKYAHGENQDLYVDVNSSEFRKIVTVSGICIGCAVGISFLWLVLIKYFARGLIIGTLVVSIALWAFFGIWVLAQGSTGGIFMLLMAALFAFCFYTWRHRIPFATAMLQTVSQRMQDYPSTAYAGYLTLIVHAVWNIFFFWVISVSQSYTGGLATLLMIFYLLSYYWTTQVIKNVLHVTVSGTFATWYFMGSNMPSNPTIQSFRRAITSSFGSIALGSLLVAVLETIRTLIQWTRRQGDNIIACCADCILGIIENLLKYFNLYAFTQVAIYGKSYVQSARDTWELLHSHGIEAIINDNLISSVLSIGALLGGVLCGIVGAIVGGIYAPDYWGTTTVIGFLIGYSMLTVVMAIVQSGVATIFVCFAMDREALRRNDPFLFQKLMETYHGLGSV